MKAFLCDDVDLDGGVTARVIDLAGMDFGNGHDGRPTGRTLVPINWFQTVVMDQLLHLEGKASFDG